MVRKCVAEMGYLEASDLLTLFSSIRTRESMLDKRKTGACKLERPTVFRVQGTARTA